jgi:oxygen-independent coproporphyrinogen-3 oxidase
VQSLWGKVTLETTFEADPLTFDRSRLEFFRQLGITRLSIGLQSTQDEVLKFLGRVHQGNQGLEAVNTALETGFEVSADLISGISIQDTKKDIHSLAQTGIKHISVYSLTIEPFTPFAMRNIKPNHDKDADDYELTQRLLQSYGLERYEVSNHAKPGHESKHNQVYWHGDYFLALGPSAASFLPSNHNELIGIRSINPSIKAWLHNHKPEQIPIDKQRYLEDILMTALRTRQGLDLSMVKERTDVDVLEHYKAPLTQFFKNHLLILEPPYLKASDEGLLKLNSIIKAFL